MNKNDIYYSSIPKEYSPINNQSASTDINEDINTELKIDKLNTQTNLERDDLEQERNNIDYKTQQELDKSLYKKQTFSSHGKWLARVLGKTFLFWGVFMTTCGLVAVSSINHQSKQLVINSTSSPYLYSNTDASNNRTFKSLAFSNIPFEKAIQTGDSTSFYKILAQNPEIAQKNTTFNVSPIALAVIYNRADFVAALIKQGVDIHQPVLGQFTLLNLPPILSKYNSQPFESRKILVENGADYSVDNYKFVKDTIDIQSWGKFWKNQFIKDGKLPILKQIVSEQYPNIKSLHDDLSTIK